MHWRNELITYILKNDLSQNHKKINDLNDAELRLAAQKLMSEIKMKQKGFLNKTKTKGSKYHLK